MPKIGTTRCSLGFCRRLPCYKIESLISDFDIWIWQHTFWKSLHKVVQVPGSTALFLFVFSFFNLTWESNRNCVNPKLIAVLYNKQEGLATTIYTSSQNGGFLQPLIVSSTVSGEAAPFPQQIQSYRSHWFIHSFLHKGSRIKMHCHAVLYLWTWTKAGGAKMHSKAKTRWASQTWTGP